MTKQQVEKVEEKAAPAAEKPEVPVKEPEIINVLVNDAGQGWRSVLVYLPAGMTIEEARTPRYWKRNQGRRQTACIKLDHLFMLEANEGRYARGIVTHATLDGVDWIPEKVGAFREQSQTLYNDGKLEVAFDGGTYYVRRMADKVRVDNVGYGSEAQAIQALMASYPKRVG